MAPEDKIVSYWTPSLTDEDRRHLQALDLYGALIKGSPYRSHLMRLGHPKALCGAAPGPGRRSGWLTYKVYERPGCAPCEACLKAAEKLIPPS